MVLKTYGKFIEIDQVTSIFIRVLDKYDPEQVIAAVDTHMANEHEFPTPVDITNIIENRTGGRDRFNHTIYSQICKKSERGDVVSYAEREYKTRYEEFFLKG